MGFYVCLFVLGVFVCLFVLVWFWGVFVLLCYFVCCCCCCCFFFFFSALTSQTASLAWWLRRPPRERKIRGSSLAYNGIFSGSSHTSDLTIGTPVVTLPGAWRYRISAGTGWPSVSILWLGEMEILICNFYLSVAACQIVWADPSMRYTRMLLGR